MDGGRLESKTLIKGARPLVLCVDKNRSDTGNVSRPKRTEACILQHTPADFLALMADVHGQPRQDHHRNGMARQTLSDPLRCADIIRCAYGQAVITDNLASLANDKCFCRIRLLILQCISPQPLIEHDITAIETVAGVAPGGREEQASNKNNSIILPDRRFFKQRPQTRFYLRWSFNNALK